MVGMLDIVSSVEASGPTRFTRALYELFGQDLAGITDREPTCDALDCPDFGAGGQNGQVVADPTGGSGYWWPRVTISFLLVGAVLTLVSMRLVVPPGMRGAFGRRTSGSRAPSMDSRDGTPPEGTPAIDELQEADS
jgi:hypothetical protein